MTPISRVLRTFYAMSLMIACASSAMAQTPASGIEDQIKDLQAQLDLLKSSYGIKDAKSTDPEHDWDPKPQAPSTTPAAKPDAKPAAKPPEKKTFPNVRLTGFFQADAVFFDQDDRNIAAVGDVQNGADFRRARLAAVGDAYENVSYMLEMDFAFPGHPNFMDVWGQINDVGGGSIRIGQFRQPIGMDGLTSVKELQFLERGLPFAFLPFRQIGMMYFGESEDEDVTWAISGFRTPTGPYGGNIGDSGGFGLATRLTALLIDNGDDGVLHIGGGYSFGDPSNNRVQYANQPEVFVVEYGANVPPIVSPQVPFFVSTGPIPTRNSQLFNAELGYSAGSFHAQSEIFYAAVDQRNGPWSNFSGGYAQAGYILTGETLPYNRANGVFGRVTPKKPFGPCGWAPGNLPPAGRISTSTARTSRGAT